MMPKSSEEWTAPRSDRAMLRETGKTPSVSMLSIKVNKKKTKAESTSYCETCEKLFHITVYLVIGLWDPSMCMREHESGECSSIKV